MSRTLSSLVPGCSIMNSLVIVLFLSGMVAMIMLRTLHKDIARYNQMDSVVSLASHSTIHTLRYTHCSFILNMSEIKHSHRAFIKEISIPLIPHSSIQHHITHQTLPI